MAGRSVDVATIAAWTTTVAAVLLTVGSSMPMARSSNAVPLHVLLTASASLTAMSRQVLISEVERIWRHEQVSIQWAQSAHTIERPDGPLRVLVISHPQAARLPGKWPVAELFPEAEPGAFAIASIDSAARVVDEAARSAQLDAHTPREYRLGLVLGRAVAHEIGHFLLATGTHADSGLMRASIDAREFAGAGGETFRLDRNASEWLRKRLVTQDAAVAGRQAGSFSYADELANERVAMQQRRLPPTPPR
jgi:hypothetical protein